MRVVLRLQPSRAACYPPAALSLGALALFLQLPMPQRPVAAVSYASMAPIAIASAATTRLEPRPMPILKAVAKTPAPTCNLSSAQLGQMVERSSARHGVPAWLVLTIMYEESRLQPCVGSSRAAMGLMQVTPILAQGLGVKNPQDPEQNIDAATRFLGMLMKRYRGHVPSVMRAYKGLPVAEPDAPAEASE